MENTTENNELIAKFMEYSRPIFMGGAKDDGSYFIKIPDYFHGHVHPREFKFHLNWNWLMEVVEKIETTLYNVPEKYQRGFMKNTLTANGVIYSNYDNRKEFLGWSSYCTLDTQIIWDSTMISENIKRYNTKIEAVYNACVEFIKWYNQQN